MDNNETNNNYHSNENQSNSKYQSYRERGGLVPVTANIINKAEVTQEETVEYQGTTIIDITAVGYIVDYKEIDNRIKITLYDYTGLLEVNFFNRLENNDSNIFDNFKYEGKREPVQIFGTLKVFHGKKIVQGAKLIKSNCSYVLYHRANVIHSWLYLTGKLKEKNNHNISGNKNEEKNTSFAGNYGNSSEKKQLNEYEEAMNILNNYAKKDNMIKEGKLEDLFRKFGSKIKDIINKLIDNNKLIENDGEYEICL